MLEGFCAQLTSISIFIVKFICVPKQIASGARQPPAPQDVTENFSTCPSRILHPYVHTYVHYLRIRGENNVLVLYKPRFEVAESFPTPQSLSTVGDCPVCVLEQRGRKSRVSCACM